MLLAHSTLEPRRGEGSTICTGVAYSSIKRAQRPTTDRDTNRGYPHPSVFETWLDYYIVLHLMRTFVCVCPDSRQRVAGLALTIDRASPLLSLREVGAWSSCRFPEFYAAHTFDCIGFGSERVWRRLHCHHIPQIKVFF